MRFLPLALTALLAAPAHAQLTWVVDSAASTIAFRVPTMVIHTVRGEFRAFRGEVRATSPAFDDAELRATVDVASVDTGRPQRDDHLRGEDFFAAARFPIMAFASDAIRRVSADSFVVTGRLSIRGVTRPVELRAARSPASDATRARITAATRINRWDYGITFRETDWLNALSRAVPIVGDSVDITLDITLARTHATAARTTPGGTTP